MRRSAWVLGTVLALGASGLKAESLTPDQQASLERLKQELWDQGYSDSEIQVEVDLKRAEFAGTRRAPPLAEEASLPRLLGQIQELVDAKVLTPERGAEAQAKARDSWQDAAPEERATLLKDIRKTLKWVVEGAWRKELVKAGMDKGLPFPKAQRDATDALIQKRQQLEDAQATFRKQGLQGDALVAQLKIRFPEVPSVYYDVEYEGPPPPQTAAPAFSDDEIDEIVDTMLEDLDEAP